MRSTTNRSATSEKLSVPGTIVGLTKNVFYTGLVSFFMDLSSEMVYPLVPLFLASMGASKSVIGLIEGIAESTASLVKVVSGRLSDRMLSRKYFMIAGYSFAILSRPILATAASWHGVLTARFIDRLGKGIRTAPRDALIAEATEEARLGRSFGFHRAMDTAGAVLGPGIAFLLLRALSQGYQSVFWLSVVPASIAVLVIIFFITEKKRQPAGISQMVGRCRQKLGRQGSFFIGIAALFAFGNSSDAFLILKAQHAGVPAYLIPVVYLLFNFVYATTAIPAGILADWLGARKVILTGFLLFAALYWGFGVATAPVALWVLFCLYGVFMGLTEGVHKAYLASIVPAEMFATAFGAYGTAVGLAVLPASIIAGLLWDHVAPAAPFFFGAATAVSAFLLFLIFGAVTKKDGQSSFE